MKRITKVVRRRLKEEGVRWEEKRRAPPAIPSYLFLSLSLFVCSLQLLLKGPQHLPHTCTKRGGGIGGGGVGRVPEGKLKVDRVVNNFLSLYLYWDRGPRLFFFFSLFFEKVSRRYTVCIKRREKRYGWPNVCILPPSHLSFSSSAHENKKVQKKMGPPSTSNKKKLKVVKVEGRFFQLDGGALYDGVTRGRPWSNSVPSTFLDWCNGSDLLFFVERTKLTYSRTFLKMIWVSITRSIG